MRRWILAAAGLVLLVPAALAQMGGPPGMPGMAPPPGPRGGPGLMPPPGRAAHFHLGRGDAVVDVKCAEDDSTKACAEVVERLLDRLSAAPAGTPPAGAPPASKP